MGNKNIIKIVIAFLYIIPMLFIYNESYDLGVTLTNLLMLMITLFNLFIADKKKYSLNKVVFFFSYFFFVLAPQLQFNNKITLWGARSITEEEVFWFNILLIIILASYAFLYRIFYRLRITVIEKKIINNFGIKKYYIKKNLFTVLILFIAIIILLKNPLLLFQRSNLSFGNSIKTLIIKYYIFPYIFVSAMVYLYLFKFKKYKLYGALLIIMAFIINNPLGQARLYVGGLYGMLLFIIFKKIKRTNTYIITLSFGLLYVFPLLDTFRNYGTKYYNGINVSSFFNMFLKGHFDSYQMFLNAIRYNFISYGKQLLGVITFAVPRSIYPTKAFGSGYTLAHEAGFWFDNISMNYFGEGYVNFGYLGIILFVIILSFILARFDKLYWCHLKLKCSKNLYQMYYYFLLTYLVFILRGDLLSGTAFLVGITLSFVTVKKILL